MKTLEIREFNLAIFVVYVLPFYRILSNYLYISYTMPAVLLACYLYNVRNKGFLISIKRNVLFSSFLMYATVMRLHYFVGAPFNSLSSIILCVLPSQIVFQATFKSPIKQKQLLNHICYSAALQLFMFAIQLNFHAIPLPSKISSTLNPHQTEQSVIYTSYTARYSGSIGDIELSAEYSALALIIGIGLLMQFRKGRGKIVFALLSIVLCGFLTITRAFYFSSIIGIGLLVVLERKLVSSRHLFALLLVIVVVAFSALLIPQNSAYEYTMERFSKVETSGDNAFNRAGLYKRSFELIPSVGFTGLGEDYLNIFAENGPHSTHSLYMETVLYSGYLGVIVLGYLLFRFFKVYAYLLNLIVRKRLSFYSVLPIIGTTILVWFINELKINATRQYSYLAMIGILFGLLAAAYVSSKTHKTST